MPDAEIEAQASETQPEGQSPEATAATLESLVNVLSPEQLQSFIAAVPEDKLRQMARDQQHPIGKVIQSEADRRMESWRQTQLRANADKAAAEQRAQRQRFLETAPDDEVAARVREEARLASIEETVRYNQYVSMFTELKPFIESLPEERRAKIAEFVSNPNAEREWYKLPTLVMKEHNDYQASLTNATAQAAREAEEARTTAAAATTPSAADLGRGAMVSGGSAAKGDGRTDDIRTVAQRLSEAGVKVPAGFLKTN